MALPRISINDISVAEAPAGYAVFDVTLDAPAADRVTVEWATQSGPGPNPATGLTLYTNVNGERNYLSIPSLVLFFLNATSDFQTDFGTVTFAPGETRQTLAVRIIQSGVPGEVDETFSVVLANPTGATIADGTGTATILDDEFHFTPTIAVAPTLGAVAEPFLGHGSTSLAFRVTLSNRYFQDVTVDYAAQDSTATAGSDYAATAGTITFAPGETEKTVSVTVLADTAAEADETMSLVLSNPQGGGILGAETAATGTIHDSPVPPPEPEEPHVFVIRDGALGFQPAVPIAGPATGLSYLVVTTDGDEVILGTPLGDFINGRGGNDAIDGKDGDDVLDGGAGSNILTGGAGLDMFFIDARPAGISHWTIITDLAPGERAVIWLNDQHDFPVEWADGWGPAPLQGLTLVTQGTALPVAVTLTGYSNMDLHEGRLVTAFGHDDAAGSDYLYVAAL